MTMPGFMQSAKGQGTHLIVAFFVAVFSGWCCIFCEVRRSLGENCARPISAPVVCTRLHVRDKIMKRRCEG